MANGWGSKHGREQALKHRRTLEQADRGAPTGEPIGGLIRSQNAVYGSLWL